MIEREAIARCLFERAMSGHAQWDDMTEPNKDGWRAKADEWIATDLKEKRRHNRRHPMPVTFDAHEDCGRWSNGRLVQQCSKAGSEDCAFCAYNRDRVGGEKL